MRRSLSFILVGLLIGTVLLLLWRFRSQTAIEGSATQQPLQTTDGGQAMPPSPGHGTSRPAADRRNPPAATSQNDRERLAAISQTYNATHNALIEFYGRVVDQDAKPIPNVTVSVAVRQTRMPSPTSLEVASKMVSLERRSGHDGTFEVTGVSGDAVDIEGLFKKGFELEPTQRTFGPGAGAQNDPVIFRMWSTNVHETLITGDKKSQVVPDGRAYYIDLISGTISESGPGDLRFWVKRPEPITYGKRYDWSCEMNAVNGGLLQEQNLNSAMHSAPATGYTNVFAYQQSANDSGWGDSTGRKRFYVCLQNGRLFGRISIELFAFYNPQTPGLVRIGYVVNPSGSRVLR